MQPLVPLVFHNLPSLYLHELYKFLFSIISHPYIILEEIYLLWYVTSRMWYSQVQFIPTYYHRFQNNDYTETLSDIIICNSMT